MPRNRNGGVGRIEKVTGKLVFSLNNPAAAVAGFYLHPTVPSVAGASAFFGIDKLISLSDVFQYYRFTRISVKCLTTEAVLILHGYYPDNVVTAVSSQVDVGNAPWVGEAKFNTIPTTPKFIPIPSGMLVDQNVKWWRTRASASVDDQFEYQGQFWCAGPANPLPAIWFELRYTIEFKNFLSTAQTPLVKALVQKEEDDDDEKEEMVLVPKSRVKFTQ